MDFIIFSERSGKLRPPGGKAKNQNRGSEGAACAPADAVSERQTTPEPKQRTGREAVSFTVWLDFLCPNIGKSSVPVPIVGKIGSSLILESFIRLLFLGKKHRLMGKRILPLIVRLPSEFVSYRTGLCRDS